MEHIDTLFGIVLPYANFFIFLGLAVYFFRKPAAKAALAKKEAFEKLMAEARQARDIALAKLAELKTRNSNLEAEVAEIRSMSQAAAAQESEKILADAERLGQHLRAEARRIADSEVEKARIILRREITDAVREAVAQRIKAETSPETQLSLVRSRIGQLTNIHAER